MTQPNDPRNLLPATATTARIVGGVAGFAFAGIGLTVLIFLWSARWDAWDSPPLFFRIFGSLIAAVFVAVGAALGFSAFAAGRLLAKAPATAADSTLSSGEQAATYKCPNCGAPLPSGIDVSPMGDVRCPFCKTWMNVHRRA